MNNYKSIFLFFLISFQVFAKVKREHSIGVSIPFLLYNNTLNVYTEPGIGLLYSYGFLVSDKFELSIRSSYAWHKQEKNWHQLVYGLGMGHFFGDNWLLSYGLLMQMVVNAEGMATAHDTMFALRYSKSLLNFDFVELAYHYSKLRYFEKPNLALDHVALSFGKIY